VRVFRNTWFTRWAVKEAISDQELKDAVVQIETGRFDADLGGGVYKQRIARSGEGKSGAYRVVVFFRSCDKSFFHYGFPKSKRANISDKELRTFKALAKLYLAMTDKELETAVKAGKFTEIEE
jgi:hypothetical protein